ncbi:MAG: HD domain-containing protein [Campylobacterota bacterium]|nr:HD domain-containing protein [Campylobacterota bacterium]
MKKILQKKIDYSYLSIDPSNIVIDSTIDFDCYIKRYNGYVIIINKGTKITQSLYDNISKQEKVYIHQLQQEIYSQYASKHEFNSNIYENQMTPEQIKKLIHTNEPIEKKILALYLYANNIMYEYFHKDSDLFSLSNLEFYVDSLIYVITNANYTFENFLEILPDEFVLSSHSVSVSMLSTLLAKELNMTQNQLHALCIAAILHDVGNRSIQNTILNKESSLTLDEIELMQKHVIESVNIAKKSGVRDSQVLTAIEAHHEKLDGSGYPKQLRGNQIPIFAQIIAVCDIFDALTTHRTYRKKYSSFDALVVMKSEMKKELSSKFIKQLIGFLHKK